MKSGQIDFFSKLTIGLQKFFLFLIPTINYKAWITKLEMACCFTFIFLLVQCVTSGPPSLSGWTKIVVQPLHTAMDKSLQTIFTSVVSEPRLGSNWIKLELLSKKLDSAREIFQKVHNENNWQKTADLVIGD